ncbi:MAG: GNAT family N-acetyltransferase [Candidatus Odinarchaeota archaeon]
MNIKILESKDHEKWNEFCYKNTWFWHTTHWIKYLLNSKYDTIIVNHSFFTEQNNKIQGIVLLIQFDDEFYSPGFEDNKKILEYIKELAIKNNIKKISVDSDIKSYLNTSKYTCILDLNNINPTKGHKAAIKKAHKYLTFETENNLLIFMGDYFDIAGKVTRPSKTFFLLEQWIKKGYGTLLKAKYKNDTAGYIYILHYKDYAYYFMSASYPQFAQLNVGHYLQSVAFELLKNKGIKHYEVGEQVYNGLIYQPTEKELNISKFKRGFGGNIILKPASEYYFDKDLFKETYLNRINNYMEREYEK